MEDLLVVVAKAEADNIGCLATQWCNDLQVASIMDDGFHHSRNLFGIGDESLAVEGENEIRVGF